MSVPTITSAGVTGGFSLEELHQFQLDGNTVEQLLRAKETNQKPTSAYEKSQGIEYHHLSQRMGPVIYSRWSFMVAFYVCQPRPELVTTRHTQTNQATDFKKIHQG